jgi:hypothetical protein
MAWLESQIGNDRFFGFTKSGISSIATLVFRKTHRSIKFYAIQCFKGKASIAVRNRPPFGVVGARFQGPPESRRDSVSNVPIACADFR